MSNRPCPPRRRSRAARGSACPRTSERQSDASADPSSTSGGLATGHASPPRRCSMMLVRLRAATTRTPGAWAARAAQSAETITSSGRHRAAQGRRRGHPAYLAVDRRGRLPDSHGPRASMRRGRRRPRRGRRSRSADRGRPACGALQGEIDNHPAIREGEPSGSDGAPGLDVLSGPQLRATRRRRPWAAGGQPHLHLDRHTSKPFEGRAPRRGSCRTTRDR